MKTTIKERPSVGNVSSSAHDQDFSWDILCSRISRVFLLNDVETKRLYGSNTARLIGAIPYVAGCEEAERTAFGHLCLYTAELRAGHGPGDHTPDDEKSLMGRLRMLTSFKGGDARVIEHGMKLLAYVMITGYRRSLESDASAGILNPFVDGVWDFDAMSAALVRDIRAFPCERLDAILPITDTSLIVW